MSVLQVHGALFSLSGVLPDEVIILKTILQVDTSSLQLPKYKNKNFLHLKDGLRYISFVKDLDLSNPGLVIDRPAADCAWFKLLLASWYKWTPEEEYVLCRLNHEGKEVSPYNPLPNNAMEVKAIALHEALKQVCICIIP